MSVAYMSHSEATAYIASMLEAIQVLHAQARAVSDAHSIPFDITLDGGQNYDQTASYQCWQSSSYNC